MKKLSLLLVCFFTSCVFNHRKPTDFYYSTKRVEISNNKGHKLTTGTAFAIRENLLLTANHVCKEFDRKNTFLNIVGVDKNAKYQEINKAEIIKRDSVNDLCLLAVKDIKLVPFEVAQNSSSNGERIYTVGCADGVFGYLSEGFIMDNFTDIPGRTVLIVAAPGYFGQSGGPILNEIGEVIGLVSGGNMSFHHIQISPNTKALQEFVKEFLN